MKSRKSLIRLKRFQVDEKRRQVSDIESMIADFQKMSGELDMQIKAEQERSGIDDVTHFAYPTFAKAAMQRRDNLLTSVEELNIQLATAQGELGGAFEELKKIELMEEKEGERVRAEEMAKDQASMDEIGLRVQPV
ncbi:MAG: flagellar export protein FliJ [Rhizobiales bacterium]|nr:flagellar export protein FliJ [Hyphomicrobiales bacterium]